MEWTALTRERLEEMISSGLEAMDDAVQDAWRGMRIEPEKWQCSPWGDQGGGFWVVAERDGCVVWYNDIEDGFNVSVFDERGTIAEYACNQTTFEEFLLGLPEARAAESPGGSATIGCPPELQKGGSIVRRQTTYWDLRSMDGSSWRVHFKAKVEARFAESRFSTSEIVDTHPVLDQYFEPWAQVFFTGIPTDTEALRRVLADRVAVATAGWRTLEEYINRGVDLGKGYGQLMRAPITVVNIAAAVLREVGLSATILEGSGPPSRPRALIMDRSAVVAAEFRFEARGSA